MHAELLGCLSGLLNEYGVSVCLGMYSRVCVCVSCTPTPYHIKTQL